MGAVAPVGDMPLYIVKNIGQEIPKTRSFKLNELVRYEMMELFWEYPIIALQFDRPQE